MTKKSLINRSTFIDIMGCSMARWHWGEDILELSIRNDSQYKEVDLGPLKNDGVLPLRPSKTYGADIWAAVAKYARKKIKETHNKRFVIVSYRSCSAIAQSLEIDSLRDWNELAKELSIWNLPFPKAPLKTYKDVWKDAATFLGKESPVPFMSFEEAKLLVRKLEISTVQEYKDYLSSGLATPDMPKRPDAVYREEWSGWVDFLTPKFLSYDEAREVLAPLNLSSENDFRALGTKNMRPPGVPSHPSIYYAEEWLSWNHFLSKNRLAKIKEA